MNEFCCIWFEESQTWIVLFPNGTTLQNNFGAVGYAVNAALAYLKAHQAAFSCTEDTRTFYRYERDEEIE